MIPSSALLSARSSLATKMVSITILLPDSLSTEWKNDIFALSRDAASRVKVIGVSTYTVDEEENARIDQLAELVNKRLVIN
jgi:hypothetical protein